MSVALKILEELWNTSLNYKGVRVNIFGIPKFKEYHRSTFKSSVSHLKKKGYIDSDIKGWYLTKQGKYYFKKKYDSLKQFKFSTDKNTPKNLLLMFDIPENKKAHREWFRLQLKKLGFVMIQKSVWVGISPLPREFKDYIKEIKLERNIKTFKLAKGYR